MFGIQMVNLHMEMKLGNEVVESRMITAPLMVAANSLIETVKTIKDRPAKITLTDLSTNNVLTYATEAYLSEFDIDE